MIYIGCAGWSIPWAHAHLFPAEGTHLARYAQVFPAVEINSSFYRHHRPATYARWAASTPEGFRFAVKVHRTITHYKRLRQPELLDEFLPGVLELGEKLGTLLLQLPPGLAFDPDQAIAFFTALRERYQGYVVCEPRNASWFGEDADALLHEFHIARAVVDPSPVGEELIPGGWPGLTYVRLHGSPIIYRSPYEHDFLESLAGKLREWEANGPVWCIFNNTVEGAAIPNALELMDLLGEQPDSVANH
ncbi:MAG TPA: DUF72 domain-containing protein [Anaerolineae bacterium]|nr:DUF72 domain-containing protein [Anaerolineae bacterium]